MELKDLEKEVRAEIRAKEEQEFREKVARRQEQVEAESLGKAKADARARERLLQPMERQAIYGVASSRILRQLPQEFPLAYIKLPLDVVTILEGAFEMHTPVMLSKVLTSIVQCLAGGDAENRRLARECAALALQEPSCFVPMVVVPGYSPETCGQMVCGWARGFKERQAAQEAAKLQEG